MNNPWPLLLIFPSMFCVAVAATIYAHVVTQATIFQQVGHRLSRNDLKTIRVSLWHSFWLMVLAFAIILFMVMWLKS